ncbi:TPA: hypothetical protein ACQDSE_001449 [Enterococcus faecium]|nr:hypothetical protein [Enterococcus faecium]HBM5600368.1 hypothetical protein [Enterococcus faecium]HBM5612222.1 hypothetical protein [Enterococcus faecium]HBM6221209.1 hypothetical protein [Enterococcus faecium]HBM6279511.1 hypothetical protein [Enterococcus faecium]
MPINYAKQDYDTFYIDWDRYFEFINQFTIFSNNSIQDEFLNVWKKRLIKSEKEAEKHFCTLDLTIEHFPIRLTFYSTFLAWTCVNIDLIEKIIYKDQISPQITNINLFKLASEHLSKHNLEPTSKILYQPTHKSSKFLDMPILIFYPKSFSFGPSVIDGNNRVHFAKEKNIDKVPCYLLSEAFFLAHPEVFLDEFCRDIFFFLADIHFFISNPYKPGKIKFFSTKKEFNHFQNNSALFHI